MPTDPTPEPTTEEHNDEIANALLERYTTTADTALAEPASEDAPKDPPAA